MFLWHVGGAGEQAVNAASMPSFRVTRTGQGPKDYSGNIRSTFTDSFFYRVVFKFLSAMHSSTKRLCPGCGRYFLPGGYTNHLKLTRDSRCKSIRDSIFQQPNVPFDHPSTIPTPGSWHTPPLPTPGPSDISDNLDSDIEMVDTLSENQDFSSADSNVNPPSPGPPVGANNFGADRQDGLNELLDTNPHHPPSDPLVITSDTDSDFSDDEDNCHQSHHQEQASPPGRLF